MRNSWKMTGDPGSGSAGFEGRLIEFKRSASDCAQTGELQVVETDSTCMIRDYLGTIYFQTKLRA